MNFSIAMCPICGTTNFNEHLQVVDHSVSHETFSIQRCPTCTLLITTPRPENLEPYYAGDQYISHAKTATSLFEKMYFLVRAYTLGRKLKLANKYHDHTHPKTVLDYGCGTGEFLRTLLQSDWTVTGVEPSAQARASSQPDIQPYIHPDQHTLARQKFSLVTLWHVLEHTDNPATTLSQLRTLMEPRARIFIAVPNASSYDAQRYKAHWAGYDVPRHLWHFTPSSMNRLIKGVGLKLETKLPMPFDSYYVSLLSEQYLRNSKHTIPGIIRAAYIATQSNVRAWTSGNYSSILYIATND